MTMGRILDGAADDVRRRLEALGVPPAIAIAMGQVAYLPRNSRVPGIPSPMVERAEAAWLISKYEEQLKISQDPFAKAALVQELCDRIFGAGGETVFDAGYPVGTAEREAKAMAEGADRYFETVALSFLGDQVMLPSTYVYGEGADERRWDGWLITKDGLIGFFEESDLLTKDAAQGSPILAQLGDLNGCSILIPTSSAQALSHIDYQGASNNFICSLRFDGGKRWRLAVWLEDLPSDLREEAMEGVVELLRIIDKALTLNLQATSTAKVPPRPGPKNIRDSRPVIRVPDLTEARSLPAFNAAMEELSFRYFENGNNPRMLWPLMEQYLQPMLYRYSLRTYMTNDEVDGQWLIDKYISYAGQSLCLLQYSNHHLQQGDLGASEHAALKDFILDSTQEMYGLVVCAIQNAGRERPTSFDGSPLEWDRELLAYLTSKLNEIVSAQDPNDPIRLAQQMMKGDGAL